MTIQIRYTCHPCGVKDQPVEVPAREAGADILDWMNTVQDRVTADHKLRRPACRAAAFELAIPMSGRAHIGGPSVN